MEIVSWVEQGLIIGGVVLCIHLVGFEIVIRRIKREFAQWVQNYIASMVKEMFDNPSSFTPALKRVFDDLLTRYGVKFKKDGGLTPEGVSAGQRGILTVSSMFLPQKWNKRLAGLFSTRNAADAILGGEEKKEDTTPFG